MAAPRTPILDDFKRGNTGPSPSSSWTNGIITFTGGLVVLGNKCAREATGAYRQGSYWNTSLAANQEVFCTVSFNSIAVDDSLTLYARLANIGAGTTDGYALEMYFNGTTTEWSLFRYDNGAATVLGSATQAIADGDKVWLQAQTLNNGVSATITGYLYTAGSWTSVVSQTDSTYLSGGYIGAELTNSQAWRFDDFGGGSYPTAGQENVTIR